MNTDIEIRLLCYPSHLTISSGISGGVERMGSRVIMSLMYVEDVPLAK